MVLQEHAALAGARAVLPGEDVLAVALAFPPGRTRAQSEAALAGDLLGGAQGAGVGGGLGLLGSNLALRAGETAPSYLLAVTPSPLHVLGRPHVGPLGGWHHLVPITSLDRSTLQVDHHQHGIVHRLTLTDSATGESVELELKLLGNGLDDVLQALGATAGSTTPSDGPPES